MHKTTNKALRAQINQVTEQLDEATEKLEAAQAEISELKEQQTKKEDEIFW